MSASEFRIPFQQVASSQPAENAGQFKLCRCGEGDSNIWTAKASENADKQPSSCPNCQVLKSGHLLISSKGIGWTSWKKRWFILTRTSLVFFRSDPSVPPPRGSEPNTTLGGIDLNNSGSVVVKEDKRLLTVLFPDGRDGRTFTLKAETSEDLNEWRSALESALAQAPSAAHMLGQNQIFRTDITEPAEVPPEQSKDKQPTNSVIGRPALFALEDIDGTPSFLEKALRFIEEYGIKVEGVLRQSADVEEVKRRVQDYENGKDEFSAEEDAHVIGDCIKYVLREMPSSPVPAACCTALVGAFRSDRTARLSAMHKVIYEVFPGPNRRLLQRILKMMQIVASHKAVNRMSQAALAACMAPLLLRPLLAGDCELDGDFSMGGDGSLQLLQAAAAANHAQAIVIILLDEYERIFDDLEEGSCSSEAYSESEDGDAEKEYSTDNDIPDDDGSYDDDLEEDIDDNTQRSSDGTVSECGNDIGIDLSDDMAIENNVSATVSENKKQAVQPPKKAGRIQETSLREDVDGISSVSNDPVPVEVAEGGDTSCMANHDFYQQTPESCEPNGSADQILKSNTHPPSLKASKFIDRSSNSAQKSKRSTMWGRTSARKNLSMEEIDYCSDDETLIQRLETSKSDLEAKIAKEVKENAILQASLERRKEALHERRLALEKDVETLREQLQKERNLRAVLESGLMNMRRGQVSFPSAIDSKTRADLEEVCLAEADIFNLKQKVCDLRGQINNQLQLSSTSFCESCSKILQNANEPIGKGEQEANQTRLLHGKEYSSRSDDVSWDSHEKQKLGLASRNAEYSQKTKPQHDQNDTLSLEISSSAETSSIVGPDSLADMVSAMDGADLEQLRKQNILHSVSSSSKLPHPKQQLATTYQRSITSSGVTSNEQPAAAAASQSGAPKRWSSKGENVKDNPEGSSTSRWNFAQKQYSTIPPVSKPQGSNSTSTSKTEESGSAPPSALAKLTSRLNFLKERRALLASEMQNLDLTRPFGPSGPSPRTDSR